MSIWIKIQYWKSAYHTESRCNFCEYSFIRRASPKLTSLIDQITLEIQTEYYRFELPSGDFFFTDYISMWPWGCAALTPALSHAFICRIELRASRLQPAVRLLRCFSRCLFFLYSLVCAIVFLITVKLFGGSSQGVAIYYSSIIFCA